MDQEVFEKHPRRKWQEMSTDEQRQEVLTLRQSRYYSLLPRKLQRILNKIR
jgi:hypothetical protein